MLDMVKNQVVQIRVNPRRIWRWHLWLIEELARNTHEVWAAERIAQGWKYGAKRDDERKHHPDLVPYDELSEKEKAYDRKTAGEVIKVLLAMGYRIEKS